MFILMEEDRPWIDGSHLWIQSRGLETAHGFFYAQKPLSTYK